MFFAKKLQAGRGAVCTANNAAAMKEAVTAVYRQFLQINKIHEQALVSVQFSITADLTAANPATLLRSAGYAAHIPLFCSVEPAVEGSEPAVIRLLFYYYARKKALPAYIGGAERLRPDLVPLP